MKKKDYRDSDLFICVKENPNFVMGRGYTFFQIKSEEEFKKYFRPMPTFGDIVYTKRLNPNSTEEQKWIKSTFITHVIDWVHPFLVVEKELYIGEIQTGAYIKGVTLCVPYDVIDYTEITKREIAEKFGIQIDKLKIID